MTVMTEWATQPLSPQETLNRAYEASMVGEGREKFYSSVDEADHVSEKPAHFSKLQQALPAVSAGIAIAISDAQNSKGRVPMWANPLADVDPDVLAYLGLICMFNSVLRNLTVTKTNQEVGAMVEQELLKIELLDADAVARQEEVQKAKEDGVTPGKNFARNARIIKQVKETQRGASQRLKSLRIIAQKNGFSSINFGVYNNKEERLTMEVRRGHLASPIVSAVLKHCDVFEKGNTKVTAKNTRSFFVFTKHAEELLDQNEISLSWMQPLFKPMLCPPTPWTSFTTGCYKDPFLASRNPLVRGATRAQKRAIEHQLKSGNPNYLRALNALQATPLCINEPMLELVQWCWDEQKKISKFPTRSLPDRPMLPDNFKASMTTAEINNRKAEIRKHFKLVSQVKGSKRVIEQDLQVAHELAVHDEFYLGWNFDWRSRMYPLTSFSYHKDDHIKSLFLYRNGIKVDGNDAYFLKVHLANVGDFDRISKAPLDDRVSWVDQNSEWLLEVGRNYKETFDAWSTADSPFSFVAACQEYVRYIDEGEDFVGYLPKSLDGSNSGVQHLSALTLAEKEGSYVSLTPSDTMSDIYQLNAERLTTELRGLAYDPSTYSSVFPDPKSQFQRSPAQLARVALRHGITRRLVKRPSMTWPYGSKAIGMGDQFVKDLMEPLQRKYVYGEIDSHPFGNSESEQFEAARFLGRASYKVITETLPKVSEAMTYVQAAALTLSKENKYMSWISPAGFPAYQDYRKRKPKAIKLALYDRAVGDTVRTKTTVSYETDTIDAQKMQNAISPNLVHSFDAAHMQNTICAMLDHPNGPVENFFMIHDSFSISGDTWELFDVVRQSFVDQYNGDCQLLKFETSVRQNMDNPTDPFLDKDGVEHKIPAKGALDITGVLESQFAFA